MLTSHCRVCSHNLVDFSVLYVLILRIFTLTLRLNHDPGGFLILYVEILWLIFTQYLQPDSVYYFYILYSDPADHYIYIIVVCSNGSMDVFIFLCPDTVDLYI